MLVEHVDLGEGWEEERESDYFLGLALLMH